MLTALSFFIQFVAAFLLGEVVLNPFLLEPIWKKRGRGLALALLQACLTFLFIGQWRLVLIVPVFTTFYALLQSVHSQSAAGWLRRELVRYLALALLAVLFARVFAAVPAPLLLKLLALTSGGLFTVFVVGDLVGRVTGELAQKNNLQLRGLENGGLWIGRLERLLIFIFIFMSLSTGIGFLVAAKSVLRFSETREDQKMAEYVLIGTLLSFALAIVASLLTQKALTWLSQQSF